MTCYKRNRPHYPILSGLIAVAVVCTVPVPLRGAEIAETDKMLAEQFAQLAQTGLAMRAITPETLRQSIALLKAARKLNPDEVRFARLLSEAALQAGDTDTAVEAFTAIYRKLDPSDQVVQMKLIELQIGKMQTAQERLKYLNENVVANPGVSAEVRSYAALLACRIMFDRAEVSAAMEKLDESLRLFPLNPEALKLKYELVGDSGTPRERVALLLTVLRSNPGQPAVMAKLASELADVGLIDQAVNWYTSAFNLAQRYGRAVSSKDRDDYTALLVIAGQYQAAEQILAQALKHEPQDVDAAFLALIVARSGADADVLEKARTDAEQALFGRAQAIGQQLQDTDPAATQPAGEINVPADIKKLQEIGDPELIAAYASTLADLAWLQIYFNEQPAKAEPVIASLRQILSPDSINLARLEGWGYLMSGQPQEASSKLSAVADRDPLAQLGMIRLLDQDPATKERAVEEARQLMANNTSGVRGAIIHNALRDKRPRLAPGEQPPLLPVAQEVKIELEAFPKEWMSFIDKPQDFYMLRGEPLKVSHKYGEPIIARVTVKNTGKYDITVGPDGAIKPDVWFDVALRGVLQQQVQGVAFDRLSQRVVLKPREQIVQTVRVDQGQLRGALQQFATMTIPLFFNLFNNPMTLPTTIAPGPGGQRVPFTRVVSRINTPFTPETIGTITNDLTNGTPIAKMHAAEIGLWFVRQLKQMQGDAGPAQANNILALLMKTTNDPDPHVRAWTAFVIARVFDPAGRQKLLGELLRDSAWEARLLGLVLLIEAQDVEQWKAVASPVADADPDLLVKEFAAAVVAFADTPAARQPTTRPSEDEDAGPVAGP